MRQSLHPFSSKKVEKQNVTRVDSEFENCHQKLTSLNIYRHAKAKCFNILQTRGSRL